MPRYGHSKDHRLDFKQLLLTVFVNGEGVIHLGSVDSGNVSDKTLNHQTIATLVTGPNSAALRALISILFCGVPRPSPPRARRRKRPGSPMTGRISKRWRYGSAAHYWASAQTTMIDGYRYRMVVYWSSALDHRKEKSLDREIATVRTTLEKAAKSLRPASFLANPMPGRHCRRLSGLLRRSPWIPSWNGSHPALVGRGKALPHGPYGRDPDHGHHRRRPSPGRMATKIQGLTP